MLTSTKFIKFSDQIINAGTIVKVEEPKSISGIDWFIKTLLDTTVSEQPSISVYYKTHEEAQKAYDEIVSQLCN